MGEYPLIALTRPRDITRGFMQFRERDIGLQRRVTGVRASASLQLDERTVPFACPQQTHREPKLRLRPLGTVEQSVGSQAGEHLGSVRVLLRHLARSRQPE